MKSPNSQQSTQEKCLYVVLEIVKVEVSHDEKYPDSSMYFKCLEVIEIDLVYITTVI